MLLFSCETSKLWRFFGHGGIRFKKNMICRCDLILTVDFGVTSWPVWGCKTPVWVFVALCGPREHLNCRFLFFRAHIRFGAPLTQPFFVCGCRILWRVRCNSDSAHGQCVGVKALWLFIHGPRFFSSFLFFFFWHRFVDGLLGIFFLTYNGEPLI